MNPKHLLSALAVVPILAGSALAQDAAKGEADFKRCRACHAIVDDAGNAIVKGGRTGPNLFGVVGRQVASVDGFSYGASIAAVGETGVVWDEENLAVYITDPKAWLAETLGTDDVATKMTFKLRKGAEDMAAYLASLGSS